MMIYCKIIEKGAVARSEMYGATVLLVYCYFPENPPSE